MNGGIYLLQQGGKLVEMNEQPYDSEDLLQELLATYPSLLAGNQIDTAEPRKWLLVSREVGVPREEDGADHWSVDHLFLDQDAIPTIVEVKRSSDTRLRREVVGQMLDYAANCVVYWPIEEIRAKFETRCEKEGKNSDEEIKIGLGIEVEAEQFWQQVKTNLQAGKIRLLFIADEIPNELRRIVEFLNQQMKSAEVLAVEIKQFTGQGLQTLVPRVIGQTAEAECAKSAGGSPTRKWDEASFFQELENKKGTEAAKVAKKILEWFRPRMTRIWFGEGSRYGSFVPIFQHKGVDHQVGAAWTYGAFEIYFFWYQRKPPFSSAEKRLELLRQLNAIAGVSIPGTAITKRPSFSLELLKDEKAFVQFISAMNWTLEQIKAS
jgi:hypothetical protein